MWNVISDTFLSLQASFRVVLESWYFFAYLLLLQCAFTVLISRALVDLRNDKETLVTLSFVGGSLGAALFSLFMALLKVQPTPLAGAIVLPISLTVIISHPEFFENLWSARWYLAFGLFILFLRLIFIQGLIAPPYADSVTHLRIVDDLLNPNRDSRTFYRLAFDLRHYYHIGFHALAAWLSGATSTAPSQAVLILGQYFQTMAVLSIYPLSRILFRNSHSAWLALIISSLFLPMPAYASNWGKYPAIASMVGINFVFSLLTFYSIGKFKPSKPVWMLAVLAMLSSTVLHSRSLAVIVIALAMIFLGPLVVRVFRKKAANKDVDYEGMIATISIALVLLFIILVRELVIPGWFLLPTAILMALAFYGNFTLAIALCTFTIFMAAGYFVSVQWSSLPERFGRVFDYPFLVIFSFIPLSILIELGIEGILRLFPPSRALSLSRWTVASLLVLGSINVIFFQDHHPSECCIFLKDDDLFTFGWMEKNLPSNALVGIAASGQPGNFLPSDGGVWIEYFTSIPTRKLDFNLDFSQETDELCRTGINYLYLDDLADSFDEYNLAEAGGIFQFGMEGVRVYRLKCNEEQ